ncbi:unnamed protein product [Closterium sp. NIES-53]
MFLPQTGRNGGREARKGGRGVAAVEEVVVVEVALGAAVVAVAVVHQAEGAQEEVLTHLLEEVRPAVWGPGGPESTGRSSSTTGWAPRPPLRDTDPYNHWCVTGPGSPCVCSHDDHSAARCFCCSASASAPLPCALGVDLCLSSLGACVSALGACVVSGPDTPPDEASLSFTLDSGVSEGIIVTFVGGGRTVVCTDGATGAVLAMFIRESRSGLYVLHTECSPVASSA